MLSAEDSELLTNIEGDAPMGQMLRRYWLPVALSSEVAEADGTPLAVRFFGEDLVVFRDTDGQIGLLNARCPHRLSSLAIGRNEERGLRCIYHGWKFDVRGRCTDMPTEHDDHGFSDRVRVRSYPTRDIGGLIWAYMGPTTKEPPFPAYRWTSYPGDQIGIAKSGYRANFLPALEGGIDSAHSWYLHRGSSRDWEKRFEVARDPSPRLEAEDTDYGFRYAAIRVPNEDPDKFKYVRVTVFVAPTTNFIPPPLNPDLPSHTQIFTPIDNAHTILFDVYHSQNGTPVDEDKLRQRLGVVPGVDLDHDWFFFGSSKNRWNQDRAEMKNGSWTGIVGFQNQDTAAVESMGLRPDRTLERLGQSDVAVIRMRRRMLDAVKSFQAGQPPLGLDSPISYEEIASIQRLVPIEEPWQRAADFAGETLRR